MKYTLATFAFLFIFTGAPFSAHAYFTTGQDAFPIDATTGAYFIDFSFGHEKYDISIPVIAQRAKENPVSDAKLSYTILNEENEFANGSTAGFVFSKADIKNGAYVVPKGTVGTFRLVVLYTKGTDEPAGQFRAHVTHLPFAFDAQPLKLNPSELKYYVTDPLPLGVSK